MQNEQRRFWSEMKKTSALAGPVIGSQLGQMSMGFVDTVMVGRLGPQELAGVALGNTLFFFLSIVSMGVIMAVAPIVSQAHGAGDDPTIERSVRQGFLVAILLTIVPFLIIWNIAPFLRAIGQNPDVVVLTQGYLRAIVFGFLPFLWIGVLRGFIEGISRPFAVTLTTFMGLGMNVLANYVLMYGKWGFPEMGLTGTGWASTFVFWFIFLSLALYTRLFKEFRKYRLFSGFGRFDRAYFREIMRIGWPISVTHGMESGLFAMTALMIGTIGTAELAAHQIAIQCAAYTFMVPMGIGIAASVRVGQAIGRQDIVGAQRAGYVAMLLAVGFMFLAALLFWVIPEKIIGLYINVNLAENLEVVRHAIVLLGIAAVFQVFDGVQVAASGALRGMKDTRVPMVIGFLSYWVIGLVFGLTLTFVLGWGAPGLWWGLVVGLGTAAILLSLRFLKITRRMVGGH